MAVRSKRLWAPTSLAPATVTVYTASSGETTLVKTLIVNNTTAAPVTVSLGSGNATGVGRLFKIAVPADDVVQVETWFVVGAGTTLVAASSTPSASVRISGYGAELEGEAD